MSVSVGTSFPQQFCKRCPPCTAKSDRTWAPPVIIGVAHEGLHRFVAPDDRSCQRRKAYRAESLRNRLHAVAYTAGTTLRYHAGEPTLPELHNRRVDPKATGRVQGAPQCIWRRRRAKAVGFHPAPGLFAGRRWRKSLAARSLINSLMPMLTINPEFYANHG